MRVVAWLVGFFGVMFVVSIIMPELFDEFLNTFIDLVLWVKGLFGNG